MRGRAPSSNRKHLAGVVEFSRQGVGLFLGVDGPEADGIVGRAFGGTTTRHERCTAMWVGRELALVYVTGEGDRKNGHFSARVYLIARHHGETGAGSRAWRREVHISESEPDALTRRDLAAGALWSVGRLNPTTTRTLIERATAKDSTFRADMNRESDERVERDRAREREQDERAKAEAEAQAEKRTRRANRLVTLVEEAYAKAEGSGVYDRDALVAKVAKYLGEL